MKLFVKKTKAFKGPSVQYIGEDGYPAGAIIPVLVAYTDDGKMFQLPNSFKVDYDYEGFQYTKFRFSMTDAYDIESKIRKQGYINSEHWVEITEQDLKDYLRGSYVSS